MSWLLEIYAAMAGGFDFLLHNHADCSSTRTLQFTLVLALTWSAGRLAVRGIASERMRRRLEPVSLAGDPHLAAALCRACKIVGFRGSIAVHWADADSPRLATIGYFRPSLVIGRCVARRLDSQELEAALAHELLHAMRRDTLRADLARTLIAALLLAAAFSLLLFLVFYAGLFAIDRMVAVSAAAIGVAAAVGAGRAVSRRMERRAEFACDRAAAAGAGGALAAAAALVKVAQLERAWGGRSLIAAAPLYSADTFAMRVRRLTSGSDGLGAPLTSLRAMPLAALAFGAPAALFLSQPVDLKQAAEAGCSTCDIVIEKTKGWTAFGPR